MLIIKSKWIYSYWLWKSSNKG